MPILKGTATFSRYRVEHSGKSPDWKKILTKGLRGRAFELLDREGTDERSAGFVELEDHDKSEFTAGVLFYGEHALFTYRIDEIRIPASTVRTELERWKKEFEKENQRPPGRREKAEAKDEIRHTLKARAPIAIRTFDVSWNLADGHLQVWAGARKIVDEMQEAIEQAFEVKLVPLVPVTVAQSLEIAESALAPTPVLSMPDARAEVVHGKA